MPKDPLAELKRKPNEPVPVTSPKDLSAEIASVQAELTSPSEMTEVDRLKATITSQSTELDKLRAIAATQKLALTIEQASPETLQKVWDTVYQAAIRSIFTKDMAYYNSKAGILRNQFQLAVIRADEAVENFILARKASADPVQRQLQEWQKNK
jgi:hypothetical protein